MTTDTFIQSLRDLYSKMTQLIMDEKEDKAKEALFSWIRENREDLSYYGSITLLDEVINFQHINFALLDWFFLDSDQVQQIFNN